MLDVSSSKAIQMELEAVCTETEAVSSWALLYDGMMETWPFL